MIRCYLALGSNTGSRPRNIERALRSIRDLPKTRLLKHSRIYETSPVGFLRQTAFLNLCAVAETALSPVGLLVELKRIEAKLGRRPARRWGPRPIDIDILLYGKIRMKTRLLEIPHPRLFERRFVLAPLAEIYPPAKRRLARLNAPSQNVKLWVKRSVNVSPAKAGA